MDITVYLPDEIGKRAKAADPELNLSRLLRGAVEQELTRRKRLAELTKDAAEHELSLQTAEGEPYTGVLTGSQLTEENRRGGMIFLATDGRVMYYDSGRSEVTEIEDAGDADDYDSMDEYIAVCDALGKEARVRI